MKAFRWLEECLQCSGRADCRPSPRGRETPPAATPLWASPFRVEARGSTPPQVEREREIGVALLVRHAHVARRVAGAEEAREATRLGFQRVDRKGRVAASARVGDVVLAAAQRSPSAPQQYQRDRQRRALLADFGWQRGLRPYFEVAAPVDSADRAALLGPDIVPSFNAREFIDRGAGSKKRRSMYPGRSPSSNCRTATPRRATSPAARTSTQSRATTCRAIARWR